MDVRPPSLWVLDRVVTGGSINLQEGVTSIGRSPVCTITVSSDYVSRVHAEFQVQPGSDEILIRDLGSTNGVFVNGEVYNNAVCQLQAGDRIGIGVVVDDDQITPDGMYPIYRLRRLPVINENPHTADLDDNEKVLQLDQKEEDSDDCIILSSSDDEFDDDVDDFVQPQAILELDKCFKAPEPRLHQSPSPPLSIKLEKQLSEDIESLFGKDDDDDDDDQDPINNKKVDITAEENVGGVTLQKQSKNGLPVSVHIERDNPHPKVGDSTIRNISSGSVKNDLVHEIPGNGNVGRAGTTTDTATIPPTTSASPRVADETPSRIDPLTTTTTDDAARKNDNNEIVPTTSPRDDFVDENEDEELFFTQQLLDDLKEELPNSDNETPGDYDVDEEGSITIKQEKFSQSLIDLVGDDDDDEYDENLETDVTNWSFKLFSKNTPNNFSFSQIYEDKVDLFEKVDTVDSGETTEKQDRNEEPLDEPLPLKQWEQSTNGNEFLNPTSSSSDEEKTRQDLPEPEKTSKTDRAPRVSDDTEEIPKKKRRRSITSDKDRTKAHYKHSAPIKTYSRKSLKQISKSTSQGSSEPDPFDKLKKDNQAALAKSSDDGSKTTKEIPRSTSPLIGDQDIEKDVFETDKPPEAEKGTNKKISRGRPEIIAPPQLPVNRGKLRGVSVALQNYTDQIKISEFQKDLKRKWLQKPSIARQQEKNKLKSIKEERKQKLKELADKQLVELTNKKRKTTSSKEKNDKELVIKHTKCTIVSRGAFLTEAIPKRSYKIPKINAKPSNDTAPSTSPVTNGQSFQDELAKVDLVIQKSHKPSTSSTCRARQKSSDSQTGRDRKKSCDIQAVPDRRKSVDGQMGQKERAPPRRMAHKLTFDAMEKYLKETGDAREKLIRSRSIENPVAVKPKAKKKVRFNDKLQIFYIEPLSSTRPVNNKKDSSSFIERRQIIRRRFPLVDHTDDLLSDILSWSQIYLQNNQFGFNADQPGETIYPMLNQFGSIDDYKRIVFPLLKDELLSHLASYMDRFKSKFKLRVEYITPYKNRQLLITKCTASISRTELFVTDMVLIEVVLSDSETKTCFGYVGNMRATNTCITITIEILPNIIPEANFKTAKQITIRRIIESLRVYFGTFNAVYQLDKTPLMEMILNPQTIDDVSPNWHDMIAYRGWDPLNEQQKEILLRTYAKSIGGYNPNVSLIKGPPGTGKSRLIANLALQYLYGDEVRVLDKKILICAQSNMAVDVITHRLNEIQKKLTPKMTVIRFGNDNKIAKSVQDITLNRLVERDHQARIQSSDPTTLEGNLNQEILTLEARIAELTRQNPQDARRDELVEMRKELALKKRVKNQRLTPEDLKRFFPQYLGNANIVCATLSSCVKLSNYVDYFDVCIIDEATQCIEPWTIMPLRFGVTSLVLVGDVQQLPATVISQKAKEYGLATSLFTRIQKCLEGKVEVSSSPILSLCVQYRMHPEICQWPNMYFYQNQLVNAANTSEFKSLIKPFSILNLEYRQNNDCLRGQITNSLEAEFVAKLVKALDAHIPNKFFSYGIITPYAQHREKLDLMIRNNGMKNVIVNTIDSYQGIEKDVIIISNARTQGVGFLANYQRLNVALTRPKKCLILCGNFRNLESVPSWASLLQNAKERDLYHNISATDALDVEGNVIEKIKIRRS